MRIKKAIKILNNGIVFTLLVCCTDSWSQSNEPINPLPLSIPTVKAKVDLGRKLFFDKRLSKDDTISCASCHELSKSYGTDLVSVSTGIKGQKGERNSPTVFNSALNFNQFWDGRATDLRRQAEIPITNPVEMGMDSIEEAVNKIKDFPEYSQGFVTAYKEGLTATTLTHALAEFQKTLLTINSPFDNYLKGDKNALSEQQLKGYNRFKAYGCISCHQGKNVGGNMYQKLGVLKDINLQHGSLSEDLGRFNVTGNEWDKRVFKVPSLRLAAVTPPYFHNGSVATLKGAVEVMIEYQLGREVPQEDILAIIEFLKSLVGELPKGVIPE